MKHGRTINLANMRLNSQRDKNQGWLQGSLPDTGQKSTHHQNEYFVCHCKQGHNFQQKITNSVLSVIKAKKI